MFFFSAAAVSKDISDISTEEQITFFVSNSSNNEDPANDTTPSVTISPATLADLPLGNDVFIVNIYLCISISIMEMNKLNQSHTNYYFVKQLF